MQTVVETLGEAVDAAAAVDLDTQTDTELDTELVAPGPGAAPPRRRDRPPGPPLGRPRRVAVRWFPRPVGPAVPHRQPVTRRRQSDHRVTAVTLAQMPVTAEAFAAGRIGTDHVDLLARAAGEGRHELFARDEARPGRPV